jgi:hypothetical protein
MEGPPGMPEFLIGPEGFELLALEASIRAISIWIPNRMGLDIGQLTGGINALELKGDTFQAPVKSVK